MASSNAPRRERVERNIYRRPDGTFEIGFKDAGGKQRWRTVDGGITRARALRDQLVAQRGRGERVADNTRLRFGDAADRWLDGPVTDLRQTTRDCYRNAVDNHLRARFGTRRLDAITPDDLAATVRNLRDAGLAESTISIVIGVTNRIYRYAARRLGWVGTNPVSLMLPSERPKPSQTQRRRLFEGTELEETLAAAPEPYRTLFTVAALTGARLSELLGLTWANLHLLRLLDVAAPLVGVDATTAPAGENRQQRRQQAREAAKQAAANPNSPEAAMKALRTILTALQEDMSTSGMVDVVVPRPDDPSVVITLDERFLSGQALEMLHTAEFTVVGRITHVWRSDQEVVNLLRRSVLSLVPSVGQTVIWAIFGLLAGIAKAADPTDIQKAAMLTAGADEAIETRVHEIILGDDIAALQPVISGPAVQILPLAICT